MNYPIAHVEFQVKDADTAMAWYAKVFGWEMQKDEKMNYVTFSAGGVGGGLNPGNQMPPGAVPYVATDNIPALLSRVEAAGGKVVMPEDEIPGYGTLALFTDPDGNTIGAINFPQMSM